MTFKYITWSSSDPAIATVDSYGFVYGKKPGTVTITASTGDGTNLKATSTITVKPKLVKEINLSPTSATIYVGDSFTLSAIALPMDAGNRMLLPFPNEPGIVAIGGGSVTGLKAGVVTITVKSMDGGNATATCVVTVLERPQSLTLNKSTLERYVGDTFQLKETVLPASAQQDVKWSIAGAAASVSQTGLVTAKQMGTSTVTVVLLCPLWRQGGNFAQK